MIRKLWKSFLITVAIVALFMLCVALMFTLNYYFGAAAGIIVTIVGLTWALVYIVIDRKNAE